ncbi:MAG: helix-turn-helix domain-containing protein [Arsenophonus sp.]|nr:helix-turn-helix domain-containing protein [Arsenophonus sp.]
MLPLPVKLDDIAEKWFISRGTIQQDMSIVREYLHKHDIQIEGIPHQGIKLSGNEWAIRTCITGRLVKLTMKKLSLFMSYL